MTRDAPLPPRFRASRHSRLPGSAAAIAAVAGATLVLVAALTTPLQANGGTVRISRAPVGPYLVTIYSSPTPLRTGEVDVSVLVQDSADAVLDVPVSVEAHPLALADGAGGEPVRLEATRRQATNKLFKAAKFDVAEPGDWEFRVRVADAGMLSFQATVARTTLLDRPWLLALLVLLPVGLVGWLMLGRDDEDEPSSGARGDRGTPGALAGSPADA